MRSIRNLIYSLACLGGFALSGCGGGGGGTPVTPTHGNWTILVYMNASNDLDAYSLPNVLQMQQAATNSSVRIIVQWKQSTKVSVGATFNGTRRYLIKPSQGLQLVSQLVQNLGSGVDMGIPKTVNQFIAWGKANYPADHYAVVMWDHGSGWLPEAKVLKPAKKPMAVSFDDETGHAIQIWQLNQAFQSQPVDILAFDASLMQMDEVAYQLIGCASYVAGSEESPPGAGYPYQLAFAEFANNPTGSPLTLSKAFVDAMTQYAPYDSDNIEQSVIDTTQLSAVAAAASNLSSTLVANASTIDPIIPQVRTNTQSYLLSNVQYYFDSIDLCNQITALTSNQAVETACANYNAAASAAIVWEGHNTHSPGSHGLSIDFSPSSYFSTVSADYSLLSWNAASNWSNWLSIAP